MANNVTIDIITDGNLLTDNDLNDLVHVLEQLTNVTADNFDIQNVRRYIDNMNKKYLLVVRCDDVIVGTGSILIEDKIIHNFGKVGHIEDVVIDNKYRGQGLAKQLVEYLIRIGREAGCYKIILDASTDVSSFYEKLGFRKHANNMRLDL